MVRAEIINGDCVDVLPRFNGQVDLIVTSPPYDGLRVFGGHGFDFDRVADACVDSLSEGGVLAWQTEDQVKDGGYSGSSLRHCLRFMELGLTLHDVLFIHRFFPGTRGANRHLSSVSYCWILSKGPPKRVEILRDRRNSKPGQMKARHRRLEDGTIRAVPARVDSEFGRRTSLWSYDLGYNKSVGGFNRAYEHSAVMPYALARDLILTYSNEGDLVLDPMCGSGTTVDAARRCGRDAVGIEIHAPYVELARDRLAQEILT